MIQKNRFAVAGQFLLAALLVLASGAVMASSAESDRAKIRGQSKEVLERLYAAQPSAKAAVEKSHGYATFSRWGLALGAVGGSMGRGLAVKMPSGEETFMRFVEGSAGAGLGIKKYALVFVFESAQAWTTFLGKGWDAGAQATFAAKGPSRGTSYEGAASVAPGVWVYQITDKGLAAEVGLKGTKYYKDKALN